jgi:hypothetical protein
MLRKTIIVMLATGTAGTGQTHRIQMRLLEKHA